MSPKELIGVHPNGESAHINMSVVAGLTGVAVGIPGEFERSDDFGTV